MVGRGLWRCVDVSRSGTKDIRKTQGKSSLTHYYSQDNEEKIDTLVAGTWTETKKMFLGGFLLELADDDL